MRLVWSLVAALGLLVGAGLAQGRFAPPEQVTQPATPHAAILIGETAQPGLAAESASPTPTRLPPAAPARTEPSVQPPGPVAPPPAAAASSAADMIQPEAARAAQSVAPSAPAAVATGARLAGTRSTATVAGAVRDDVVRPQVDAPPVSAPTPTPCVLEPPPRYLDTAPRGPEQ